MPLSRQQYVSGIVAEMRVCHGDAAHAVILRRAAAFRQTGNDELADVWNEAGRAVGQQEARIAHLAELGYVPEDSLPRARR